MQDQVHTKLHRVEQDIRILSTSQSESTTIIMRTEGMIGHLQNLASQSQLAIHDLASRVLNHGDQQIPDQDILRMTNPIEAMIRRLFQEHQASSNSSDIPEQSTCIGLIATKELPIRQKELYRGQDPQYKQINEVISKFTSSEYDPKMSEGKSDKLSTFRTSLGEVYIRTVPATYESPDEVLEEHRHFFLRTRSIYR